MRAQDQLSDLLKNQQQWMQKYHGFPVHEKPKPPNGWFCALYTLMAAYCFMMVPIFLFYTPQISFFWRIFTSLIWLFSGVSYMLDFAAEITGIRDLR